jgi:hypothetical protein
MEGAGLCGFRLESTGLRGFGHGGRLASRIWAWRGLGFEDLGVEGAGGLGLPWLAGLGFEDLGLEGVRLRGFGGAIHDRPSTDPRSLVFKVRSLVSKVRNLNSKLCNLNPKPLAVLRCGGRGFAPKL